MKKPEIDIETLTISSFGVCTLLPINPLPESKRKYNYLYATARELGLTSLPELGHYQVQEIFKAVTQKLIPLHPHIGTGVSVWLSGVHLAYPEIRIEDSEQVMEPSVSSIDILHLDMGSRFSMSFNENPFDVMITLHTDEVAYCLFLGSCD